MEAMFNGGVNQDVINVCKAEFAQHITQHSA